MIRCFRIGFVGGNPEDALTAVLQQMEANGHRIVSVSVLKPGELPGETHEAYVVSRFNPGDCFPISTKDVEAP